MEETKSHGSLVQVSFLFFFLVENVKMQIIAANPVLLTFS